MFKRGKGNAYDKLKPSSNRTQFKLVISDQALTKLIFSIPKYVRCNRQKFSSVFEYL